MYISGGHGAMGDMPHDADMTQVVRWIMEAGQPLAVVCHGQSALLPLRDEHGNWLFEGYAMTAFSHDEELVTDMAGKLPFVLQVELERLGAKYEKSPNIWARPWWRTAISSPGRTRTPPPHWPRPLSTA